MKNLNQFIIEKLKIDKNITQYNYFPKTRDELEELINKLIKERGNDANLNDIDTSKITDMSFMFRGSKFNGDISEWDTKNVEDMSFMFYRSKFNGNISDWKVNNVVDMGAMFHRCPLEKNPPAWYKE